MINNKSLPAWLTPFILLGLLACSDQKPKDEGPPSHLVKTLVVTSQFSEAVRTFPGQVVASQKVRLAFQVSGQIIKLHVVEGQVVQKGQVLAEVDPRDYLQTLVAEKAELTKKHRNYLRGKELLRSGTIPEARYDEFKAMYEVALSTTATAQKAYDDTFLRAPFDGLVANKVVDNFQNIHAKETILNLQDISHIDIEVDIPEKDMADVEPIRKAGVIDHRRSVAKVEFLAVPGKVFPVRLKEFATEADPVTQTFRITFIMPSPQDLNILPGMTATLIVDEEKKGIEKTYHLPIDAIAINDAGEKFVWIVDKTTLTVKRRDVTTGMMSGKVIEVISGVKTGDRVVTAGVAYLEPGMKVKLMNVREGSHP